MYNLKYTENEEMNALDYSKRRMQKNIYGPIKEEESWGVRTDKEIENILQGKIL